MTKFFAMITINLVVPRDPAKLLSVYDFAQLFIEPVGVSSEKCKHYKNLVEKIERNNNGVNISYNSKKHYHILSSIMRIQVQCAPEFYNDFWQKQLFLFFKNNSTRINHCKFIHHKSHLKPFLSYFPCIVCREYFSIIFNVKSAHYTR